MSNPEWQKWEVHVQEQLGLRSTIGSGNKFYDPSDGVDVKDHTDSDYLLMVDSKFTETASYRVNQKLMSQWVTKAREMGYRFALPIKLTSPDDEGMTEFVVFPFDDFVELVESYRKKENKKPVVKTKKPVLDEDDKEFLTKITKAISNASARTKFLEIVEKMEKHKE